MKKKIIALLITASTVIAPVYVYADEKDDRIAEFEAQVADLQVQLEEALAKIPSSTDQEEYKIEETWGVENAFKVTIDSVEETQDRNPYDETNPAAVYVITYTYENIGLEEELYLTQKNKTLEIQGFFSAADRNRTGTGITTHGILSPYIPSEYKRTCLNILEFRIPENPHKISVFATFLSQNSLKSVYRGISILTRKKALWRDVGGMLIPFLHSI